jgi:metal-responsive CopG/Arc/MetJ family transcriptional regulator
MEKNSENEIRTSVRIPESLYNEVEKFISLSGMPFIEFLRRALREKLDRDTGRIVITPEISDEIARGVEAKLREWGYEPKNAEGFDND